MRNIIIKVVFLATVCLTTSVYAQTEDKWGYKEKENKENQDKWTFDNYTRGSGFVIRPELYSGLFATIGYQFNPYVQLSGGVGVGLDQNGGTAITL